MRVVASLGVKDEVELVGRAIDHLLAIGVDLVVVCDLFSTDGTAELVRRRTGDRVWMFQMSDRESQEAWSDAQLDWARRGAADWLVLLDADEFPLPASGSLHDVAALADADVLVLDRFNIPAGPAAPPLPDRFAPERYDELLVLVEGIPAFWKHLREHPETPITRKRLLEKVMVRPDRVEGVTLGTHDVVAADAGALRRVNPPDLVSLHLPFTSWRRFARKAENLRETLAAHEELFGRDHALHWRRWATQAADGGLRAEFERLTFSEQDVAELREAGIVRTAAELFAERLSAPRAQPR